MTESVPRRPACHPSRMVVPSLLLTLAACTQVTLDLRRIKEPVVLNALPYAGALWTVTEVEKWTTSVSQASGMSSDPLMGADRHTEIDENPAQLQAYHAIGGHSRRVIVLDTVEGWGGAGNLLIVWAEMTSVTVRGKVVELEARGPGGGQ